MLTYTRNSKQVILHATRVWAVTRVCLAYTITVNATQKGIIMEYKTIKLFMRVNNNMLEWTTQHNATHWAHIAVCLLDLSSTEFNGPYGIENNAFDKKALDGFWALIQKDWIEGNALDWAKEY